MTKKIIGPQSIIEISSIHGEKIVHKISTERGNQDTLDQIDFYKNLPSDIATVFPEMISYNSSKKPYTIDYKYISGDTLRSLSIQNELSDKLEKNLSATLNDIHKRIHLFKQFSTPENYVNKFYFNRLESRLSEVQSMVHNADWIFSPLIYNDKLVENPISHFITLLNNNKDILKPDYICTTHGQLGPSHIIYTQFDTGQYKLIDPKGFDHYYDPLYDICKIGKGLVYATEWLEDKKYSINYTIDDDRLTIQYFTIDNFDREKFKDFFHRVLDDVAFINDNTETSIRLQFMIITDIIASLPFGWKTEGDKRVVALLCVILWAVQDLEDELHEQIK